ncbi:hypothetical protein Dimus_012301 [Dionaea muscipula]
MASQVVKVRRDKIAACMICPLCNKLLKEATTISLCLHTFCRKCIYEKLSDEDVDSCPVCDINLGAVPVDKLRPDHNLQDVRSKIFPRKKKVEALEAVPSVSPPAKRKERSLSSLVVSAPRVPLQTTVTGRRTRAGVRKAVSLRGSSPSAEEPSKWVDDDSKEDRAETSSSPETLNKIIQNKKQLKESCSAKSSDGQTLMGDLENNSNVPWEGKDLWKPLNCLVEAANRTKLSKSNLQGPPPHIKSEVSGTRDVDSSCMPEIKTEDNELNLGAEAQDDRNCVPSLPKLSRRKRRPYNQNKEAALGESPSSPQLVLNAVRPLANGPVWFSLVSSDSKEGGIPLPQISSGYLRVKDGSMTVSYIQKYLAKKFDLTSETEVQISFQGHPLLPTLQLQSVLQLWLQTAPTSNSRVLTTVGSSAKHFVMVLNYSRQISPPPPPPVVAAADI